MTRQHHSCGRKVLTRSSPASLGLRNALWPHTRGENFSRTTAFTGRVQAAGIQISMDGRGRCMDNVFIERLWRSLKYECVYLSEFATGSQARTGIGGWMDFYDRRRPHSAEEREVARLKQRLAPLLKTLTGADAAAAIFPRSCAGSIHTRHMRAIRESSPSVPRAERSCCPGRTGAFRTLLRRRAETWRMQWQRPQRPDRPH